MKRPRALRSFSGLSKQFEFSKAAPTVWEKNIGLCNTRQIRLILCTNSFCCRCFWCNSAGKSEKSKKWKTCLGLPSTNRTSRGIISTRSICDKQVAKYTNHCLEPCCNDRRPQGAERRHLMCSAHGERICPPLPSFALPAVPNIKRYIRPNERSFPHLIHLFVRLA